jgi:hypothetical protein
MDENQAPDVPPVDDTLSTQPALLEQAHYPEAVVEEVQHLETEIHDLEHPVKLVCPICGLTVCTHNLPYIIEES